MSPPNFSFPASHGATLCKAYSYLLIGVGQFLVFTWSVKDATILEWAKQHPDYPLRVALARMRDWGPWDSPFAEQALWHTAWDWKLLLFPLQPP